MSKNQMDRSSHQLKKLSILAEIERSISEADKIELSQNELRVFKKEKLIHLSFLQDSLALAYTSGRHSARQTCLLKNLQWRFTADTIKYVYQLSLSGKGSQGPERYEFIGRIPVGQTNQFTGNSDLKFK